MIKCCDWRIVRQKGVTSVWVIETHSDNSHKRWCYQQDLVVHLTESDVREIHEAEFFFGDTPTLRSVKWEYL